jgi:uncharacterized RDD family membrane protein YckC
MADKHYAGFWVRTLASLIDTAIILAITVPLLLVFYDTDDLFGEEAKSVAGPADFFITWILPIIFTILFWMRKKGTPGKLVLSAQVVDAETGENLSLRQSVIRYLGYFVSMLPLCLGFIWVAFDKKKQGWHDKMAGTVVIRK